MSNVDYRPFTVRDPRRVLAALKLMMRRRGVAVRWDRDRPREHFHATIGGEGGLVVHVSLGRQRIPRLGKLILLQAYHPSVFSEDAAPSVAYFCDRANEALYGSKLYLRQVPDHGSTYQVVVERGCVIGGADLFRLADEFDLLVTEFLMADEQMEEHLPKEMQLSLPYLMEMYDEPVAENC